MQTLHLGHNGPVVPALGIGTWSWGDKLFWSYGKDYGQQEVREAFENAIASGVTFFDTAEVYGTGDSEKLLGEFIKATGKSVQIATKYGPFPWRFSGNAVSKAITASLQRLQLTEVTLYQVHWPFTFFMSQDTLMNALADEVEKGRIRAIGVSNYSADQMRQAHEILAKRNIPLAVNQVRYSLLNRQIESNGILETAQDLGVTILAYSPLAQGLLTGKYSPGQSVKPTGARSLDSRFSAKGLVQIEPVIKLLREFGQEHQKTPAQVALNWLIAQGNIIPIPGAKNGKQATENAAALGWSLTPEQVSQLSEATQAWMT